MAAKKPKLANHPIYPLAQKKWRSSGLTDDHAELLHLQPLTGEETSALAGNFHSVGALRIPYFDLEGNPTEFYRLRYLEDLPGFAGAVEKPQRYAQPAGTINEVYLPPLLPTEWKDVAEDPHVPLYITEGEFKAASACAVDLACIGLGGVDVWRAKKRGADLLPALRAFEWKSRNVTIVFDSDAASNPSVVRAQRQLAAELLSRGALPCVASLPPRSDGVKQGLDDFLLANGPEALMKILQDAPPLAEADALWEMNEELIYVNDPGIVVEREGGRRMDPNKFCSHHYSNRWYTEIVVKNNVPVARKKPLARRWLDWEGRYECDRIIYAPGQQRIVDGAWNTWPGWGREPKKGDVSVWSWLLDRFFAGDPAARKWFEQWCAYPIQHPGTKMFSSAVLWSNSHGVGKNLLAYSLMAIYGKNAVEINSEALRASFNSWAEHRQFVIGDEITAGEARLDKDKLKHMIVRQEIRINQKFMPEYMIPDVINYMFMSNSPDAMFVEDKDRRYFIWEIVGEKADREFYERYDRWLNGDVPNSRSGPGPAALMHHLLNVDLKGFNPRADALMTASKQAMSLLSKSDLAMWVVQLREDPTRMVAKWGERTSKECDLFTPSALLHCYDPEGRSKVTAPGMARELVRAGFRQVNAATTVRTRSGIVRLYAIRNGEKWKDASPKDIASHYDRYFGPDSGKC